MKDLFAEVVEHSFVIDKFSRSLGWCLEHI